MMTSAKRWDVGRRPQVGAKIPHNPKLPCRSCNMNTFYARVSKHRAAAYVPNLLPLLWLSLHSAFGLRPRPCVRVCVWMCVCVHVCSALLPNGKVKNCYLFTWLPFCWWLKPSADERKAIWLLKTWDGVSCAIKVSLSAPDTSSPTTMSCDLLDIILSLI